MRTDWWKPGCTEFFMVRAPRYSDYRVHRTQEDAERYGRGKVWKATVVWEEV